MQKFIHQTDKSTFDKIVETHLTDGWKVVPGTYTATSHPSLAWNPATMKTNLPSITDDYAITLERPEE